MREHQLLVRPNRQLPVKRTSTRNTPKPTTPHEWWGTDMTNVRVEGCGWVDVVLVLHWYPKKIVGDDAGVPCTARPWLEALDMAVHRQCPDDTRGQGGSVRRAHHCQPPSLAFMRVCATVEIPQAFTSYNNPKGNADTERVMRTLKEEWLRLTEWTWPFVLIKTLEAWMADDNEHYWLSALGDKPPRQFERDYDTRHSTPFVAA